MTALTPLICRDYVVFLKAFACSVKFQPPTGPESSSLSSSRGAQVSLLYVLSLYPDAFYCIHLDLAYSDLFLLNRDVLGVRKSAQEL